MKTFTGNYKPSGFAIAARRGGFAISPESDSDRREIVIEDGGYAPKIGCVAWLCDYPGCPGELGHVVACKAHCNGRVTVAVEFP